MQNLQSADSTLLMSMTTPITTSAFVVPKTGRTPDALPGVSVVVPLLNEQESIPGLVAEIHTEMSKICTFEIVLVDDGSRDHTRAVCLDLATRFTGLRVIGHARPAGQSAAVHSGVLAARGAVIATLDGDGQNPPENLPRLLAPLLAQPKGPGPRSGPCLGLVAGQRVGRKDSLSKRLASRLANRLRMALLSDNTRDTGCGLKAFRRDAYLALPFFNHQHRYLPALFARDGWGGGADRCQPRSAAARPVEIRKSVAGPRRHLRSGRGGLADPAAQDRAPGRNTRCPARPAGGRGA